MIMKRATIAAFGLASGLALGAPAAARAEENRLNVHLDIGGLATLTQPDFFHKEQIVKTGGASVRLGLEYEFSEWMGVELAYEPDVLIAEYGGAADIQQRVLAGVRVRPWWNRERGWVIGRPAGHKYKASDFFSDVWIEAHAGISASGTNRLLYDVGVGARTPLVWPLQVGVFARFEHLFAYEGGVEDDPKFMQLIAGLTFSAGVLPVHPAPDADRDGVPDAIDRCPDTPRDAEVNDVGCQQKKGTSPPPRCSDTDLDGVCDGGDQCPDTPLGTQVDTTGCPLAAPGEGDPPNPS